MKNLNILVLCFLFSLAVSAQNYSNENTNETAQKTLLYLNNSVMNFDNQINQSSVYIQQFGSDNKTDVRLSSSDSEVGVNQFGNANSVDLDVTALQIRTQINQFGDSNNFTDYSYAPQNNYNAQINQYGNNQSIYVNGSNSLSKDLKINLSGNNKTIFVNNFQ